MIVFPQSSLVGKPIPKTALYRNLEVNAEACALKQEMARLNKQLNELTRQ